MKKNDFEQRHIGPKPSEQTEMLRLVGYESMESLMDDVVPGNLRLGLSDREYQQGDPSTRQFFMLPVLGQWRVRSSPDGVRTSAKKRL